MKKLIAFALLMSTASAWGATCHISEYANVVNDDSGRATPVASEPAVAVQVITYTTSTQSTAFNASTRFIRVICTAKAHFEFGTNPTATANDPYLPADTPEYFGVAVGATYEIAVYDGSS